MSAVAYRSWSPPQSPLKIAFPQDLLDTFRGGTKEESSGVLHGWRREGEVQIRAVGGSPASGLETVGIFFWRPRGEVFLTDADLARFEQSGAPVALVVSGDRAGFFVREADGSLQAIRSHEEFRIPSQARRSPIFGPPPPYFWRWATVTLGLACVPIAALVYLRPALPRPAPALHLHEESSQLVIGWNPRALANDARLEIAEGNDRKVLALANHQSSVTYAVRSADVDVRLATDAREDARHWDAARYVTQAPKRGAAAQALKDRIQALEREESAIRASVESRQARTSALEKEIGRLVDR